MKIKLRTKTEEHLNKLFDTRKVAVINYIEAFMEFPEDKAFSEMVRMKVSPERILEKNKSLNGITTETISKIYGDVAYNYKIYHPDCWLNRDLEVYPVYLRKALDNDKTLIGLIEKKVTNRIYSVYNLEINRLHFLLQSDKEEYNFGGLKELWFTKAEANFFKNYAKVIDEYICYVFSAEDEIPTTVHVNEEVFENPAKVDEEKSEAIEIPIVSDSISAIEVINNADKINRFLFACDKLKEVGIEPETVLKNAEKIELLLRVAENL